MRAIASPSLTTLVGPILAALLVACGGAAESAARVTGTTPLAAEAPDQDADRVPDGADACPTEPEDLDGYQDGDGCPDPDNDGDGIADVDDRCPDEHALRTAPRAGDPDGEATDGCPLPGIEAFRDGPPGDADDDGYADDVDRCPYHPESFPSTLDGGCTDDGDGCPDGGAMLAVACGELMIAEVVVFDSGSAALPPRVVPLLDAIAALLIAQPQVTVALEGHLDDRERGDLGLRRALAVRDALVARGVPVERLDTRDLGSSVPNESVRGLRGAALGAARERNRRVSFRITSQPRMPGRPRR